MNRPGPSRSTFSQEDPELRDFSIDQIAYLNQRANELLDNVAATASTSRVTMVNSRIDPPYYNPDTMSAASFFSKCEKYFRAQSYPESQFHNMIHTILKHNVRLWFDSVVKDINSWEEFKNAFQARFDKPSDQERRKRLLYSRKQKNESCEQFIQEMVTLARQVDENETENVSVNRAYHGIHPELILNTGCLDNLTINSLMEKLAFTYDAIRARDGRKGGFTWLPPLYGYNVEKGPQYHASGNRGRGRGQGRGYGFRSQPYTMPSQGQQPNPQQINNIAPQNNPSFSSQHRNQTQQQMPNQFNRQQHSGNYQQQPGNNQTFQRTSFQNQNRGGSSSENYDKSKMQCRNCNQFGHFARYCPQQQGIANMAFTEQEYPPQYQQQNQEYPPQYQQQNQDVTYNQNTPQPIYTQYPGNHQFPQNHYNQQQAFDGQQQTEAEYQYNSNQQQNSQHLNSNGGPWKSYAQGSSQQ
ncbi:unnamed protein product [Orchesella dallaii]|uniref:CCHC-type domain-containing protein n=1 Tax=Orchesella dallaii TaxID=48710 RepID=A0ABP1RHZ1_9HEXA